MTIGGGGGSTSSHSCFRPVSARYVRWGAPFSGAMRRFQRVTRQFSAAWPPWWTGGRAERDAASEAMPRFVDGRSRAGLGLLEHA